MYQPAQSTQIIQSTPSRTEPHMYTILIFKHVEWVRLLKQWVGLRGGRDMDHGQHGAASDEGDPWHVLTYKANLVDPLWFVSGICVVRDGAWETSLMAWDDMWHAEVTCDDLFLFLFFTWSLRNLGELYRFVSIGARKNSRKGNEYKKYQDIGRQWWLSQVSQ